MSRRALAAFALALLPTTGVLFAAPRIELVVEPTQVTVGDRITALLTVTLDPGDARTPSFPNWESGWGKLQLVAPPTVERVEAPTGALVRQRVELAAFEPGKIDLPLLEVAFGESAQERLATAAPPAIEVVSVLPEEEGELVPKPAAPPQPLALPASFWWTVGLLAAAVLALAIAVARRKRPAAARVADRALSPREELERALAQLADLDPEPAHASLSLALRRWLGRVLDLPAAESTTAELAERLPSALERATVQRTTRLLREVDQVKFARRATGTSELDRRVEEAKAIVVEVEVKLAPPPPPPAVNRTGRRSAA